MAKGFFNGEYVNGIPVVDSALSDTSVRPVQNKVVKGAIDTLNNSLTNKMTKDDYFALSRLNSTISGTILDTIKNAPRGLTFHYCQGATDSPYPGQVSFVLINKASADGSWTYTYLFVYENIYYCAINAVVPSSLTWTKIV